MSEDFDKLYARLKGDNTQTSSNTDYQDPSWRYKSSMGTVPKNVVNNPGIVRPDLPLSSYRFVPPVETPTGINFDDLYEQMKPKQSEPVPGQSILNVGSSPFRYTGLTNSQKLGIQNAKSTALGIVEMRNKADEAAKIGEFEAFRTADDFSEYSQYKPADKYSLSGTVNDDTYGIHGAAISFGGQKEPGAVQTTDKPIFDTEEERAVYERNREYSSYMNDDEKALFNYVMNKFGGDKANEYFNTLEPELLSRRAEKKNAQLDELANEHPVESALLARATNVASQVLSPIDMAAQGIGSLLSTGRLNIDQNSRGLDMARATKQLDSSVGNKLYNARLERTGSEADATFAQFLYGVGTSMADSFINSRLALALSGGQNLTALGENTALGMMGAGAAAQSYIELKNEGYTTEESLTLGLIAGAAEYFTEKVSLETLLDPNRFKDSAMKYILKNGLAEGSEEVASDFINTVADVIMLQDKSQWQKSINEYMENGYTQTDAVWNAVLDKAKEMGVDFVAGALSGVGMSGAQTGLDYYGNNAYGQSIKKNGDLDSFLNDAYNFADASPEESAAAAVAEQIRNRQERGKEIPSEMLGRMQSAMYEQAMSETQNKGNLESLTSKYTSEIDQLSGIEDVMNSLYTGKESATEWFETANRIYNAGKNGADISNVDTTVGGEPMMAATAMRLYNTGQNAVKTFEGVSNGKEGRNSVLHDNQERNDRQSSGVEVGRVSEESGSNDGRRSREAEIETVRSEEKAVREVSAKELGFKSGTDTKRTLVEGTSKAAQATTRVLTSMGFRSDNIHYFTGGAFTVQEKNGDISGVRGVFQVDANGNDQIYIQLDDAYASGEQIARHEGTHYQVSKGRANVKTFQKYMKKNYSREIAEIVEAYHTECSYLSNEELWEEIMCDFAAGMNIFEERSGYERATSAFETLSENGGMQSGLNAARTSVKTENDGGIRFSRTLTVDGKTITIIENTGLSNKDLFDQWKIEALIASHIGEMYRIIEDGNKVYIGEDTADEYIHSKYTQNIKSKAPVLYKGKNRLVNDFGLLIENAKNRRWEKTKHPGSKDAKYGMYRYDITFAIKSNDGSYSAYTADLLIRNASDGNKYLYDIVNMKKSTATLITLQNKEGRLAAYNATARSNASVDMISSDTSSVNNNSEESYEKHSISSFADSLDMVAHRDGTFTYNGKIVKQITNKMVEDSRLYRLIQEAESKGFIDGEDLKAQKEFVRTLMQSILDMRDPSMTYAFSGSMLWSGIKENTDKQYKKTIDFEAVCKKTEQMVASMSEAMIRKGRGLTLDEITKLYNEVVQADEPVPCPACYVFSRWIGLGGLLDNIKSYQEKYKNATMEEMNRARLKVHDKVEAARRKDERFGQARSRMVNDLSSKAEKIVQERNSLVDNGATKSAIAAVDKQYAAIMDELTEIRSYEWLEKVRMKKNYKPVPDNVLFNLLAGQEFATDYADAWGFRTSQGAGYGKAITPYADARLGETIQGLHKGMKSIKVGEKNPFYQMGDEFDKAQKAEYNAAIKAVAQQNLRGGVRMQSVSDFRYEYALDYIQTFFELESVGAGIQTYTKVVEFVPIISSIGGFVNMSLMPKGTGIENGKLVFSDIIGINHDTAFELQNEYGTAGCILMGISDEHIILAMADERIPFIIPYHKSGGRNDVIDSMLQSIGEKNADEKYKYEDYSNVQSEKFPKREEQNKFLQLRNKILKGNTKLTLTAEEQNTLAQSKYLQELYDRKYNRPGDSLYHVQMTATDCGQIFPYEYWDESLSLADADENGRRYLEYCEQLGVKPKFSGNAKGEHDFREYTGYWKLLIDRRMYGLDGTYNRMKAINASGLNMDDLDTARAQKRFGESMSKRADLSKTSGIVDRAFPETVGANEREQAVTKFSKAPGYNPKKTIEVYKLMRLQNGGLYPLFIDNANKIELNTWYKADSPDLSMLTEMPSGTFIVDYENRTYETLEEYQKRLGMKVTKNPSPDLVNRATEEGKRWIKIRDTENKQRRFGGETRSYWNLGTTENVDGKTGRTKVVVAEYSMRPGWHAGSLPSMQQIPNTEAERTFVWVKGLIPADINYQEEANRNPDKDIPTHIPDDGYYLKATNANKKASQADRIGWYVAGAFKPTEIISYKQARDVIDKWNREHPAEIVEYDFDRLHGKDIDPKTLNIVDAKFSRVLNESNRRELDDRGVRYGIHIRNDGGRHYASMIANGEKVYETRDTNSLDDYVGQRVALIETGGRNGAMVVGYATVGKAIEMTEAEFHTTEAYKQHMVPKGSKFDVKPGGMKYLYPMENVEKVEPWNTERKLKWDEGDNFTVRDFGEPNRKSIEESTSINDDKSTHTDAENKRIDDFKKSADADLLSFYEKASESGDGRYELDRVSDRLAADIWDINGHDIKGFKTVFDGRQAKHIYDEHGEYGKADHTMKDPVDVSRIQYVLDNYDSIEDGGRTDAYWENRNGRNRQARTVVLKKKVDGTYYVIEATPVTKAKSVYIVSAYMVADGKTSIHDNKKEGTKRLPDAETAPWSTPKSDSVVPSEMSVSPSDGSVKASRSIDTEYLNLAKDPTANRDRLRKIVADYAASKGFTTHLYHGTTDFGFTKIDTSKSDDGISFFATDSPDIARTYSRNEVTRDISMEDDEWLAKAYAPMDEADDKASEVSAAIADRLNSDYPGLMVDDDMLSRLVWDRVNDIDDASNIVRVLDKLDEEFQEYEDEWYEGIAEVSQEDADDAKKNLFPKLLTMFHELKQPYYDALKRMGDPYGANYDLLCDTSGALVIDANGDNWDRIHLDAEMSKAFHEGDLPNFVTRFRADGTVDVTTRSLAEYAKLNGIEVVKIENVYDDGGKSPFEQENPGSVYIFLNPQERVKSADPVTYDEDGEIIPLSERFNRENNDIRYSRTTSQKTLSRMVDSRDAKIASLKEQNRDLRSAYNSIVKELAKSNTELHKNDELRLTGKALDAIVDDILYENESTAGIKNSLKQFAAKMLSGQYEDADRAKYDLNLIASEVLKRSPAKDLVYSTDPSDILNINFAIESVSNDIMSRILDNASIGDKRVMKLQDQIEKIKSEASMSKKAALESLREQSERKLAEQKKMHRDYVDTMRERRDAKELRTKIEKHVNDLNRKLNHPTTKSYIPKELSEKVRSVLYFVNMGSGFDVKDGHRVELGKGNKTMKTRAFENFRQYLKTGSEGEDANLIVAPEFLEDSDAAKAHLTLLEMYSDRPIATLNSEELGYVYKAIREIEGIVNTTNKMFNDSRWASVNAAIDAVYDETGSMKSPLYRPFFRKIQKFMRIDMLRPQTYFHMMGDTGDSLFRMFRAAQDEQIRLLGEVEAFTRGTFDGVDIRKLNTEKHTVTYAGTEVEMTTSQIMYLYLLSKREQGIQHLLSGSIYVRKTNNEYKALDNLKSQLKSVEDRYIALPAPMSQAELESDIANMANMIGTENIALADKLGEFMSGYLSDIGNETSLKVFNVERFTEKNYVPIKVHKNELNGKIEGDIQRTTHTANAGFTNAVSATANQGIDIGSLFDVFNDHASEMIKYCAWTETLEDMNRIFNGRVLRNETQSFRIKDMLDRAYGDGGAIYLRELMADLATPKSDESILTGGLIGKYKAASVSGNMRVIIQQPTAILRAGSMLDSKYMVQGVTAHPFEAFEEAMKYAPIAKWKDYGFFDADTGKSIQDILWENSSKMYKLQEKAMALPGKADSLAWGYLWNAVKNEQMDLHKGMDFTSGEFLTMVGQRFAQIVDKTQVVDGVLQRSQIARSKNAINKMATSFMSEPILQLNMVYDAAFDLARAKRTGDDKELRKAVKNVLQKASWMLFAGITNALAQSIIDAMRDTDVDKDYLEKLMAKMGDNTLDFINPIQYIPYAKDAWSILQGYDVSRMDMQGISDIITACRYVATSFENGKFNTPYALINLASKIAKTAGIPAESVKKDALGLVNTVFVQMFHDYEFSYDLAVAQFNFSSSAGKTAVADILYEAYKNDRAAYERIKRRCIEAQIFDTATQTTAENIESRMKAKMKKEAEK